jgi:hypothetical protein
MQTLLGRPLDGGEQQLQEAICKNVLRGPQIAFSKTLWQRLGLPGPEPYFAAVLSLIHVPPKSAGEVGLCSYLVSIPDFYVYLANPICFSKPALISICRALMRIEQRFDVKLISALAEQRSMERQTFVRALSVLDEISPGRRLTMTLARVLRDAEPEVASKVALMMGHRVLSPLWVERQLGSGTARTRANVIETLWGVDTKQSRTWMLAALNDINNRVVGNALVGLHLLKDSKTDLRIREMARHPNAAFRATAAWVMSKTGEQSYCPLLTEALADPDDRVRGAAKRALEKMPEQPKEVAAQPSEFAEQPKEAAQEPKVTEQPKVTAEQPKVTEQPETQTAAEVQQVPPPAPEVAETEETAEPEEDSFLRLDGSFAGYRR